MWQGHLTSSFDPKAVQQVAKDSPSQSKGLGPGNWWQQVLPQSQVLLL